VAILAATVAEYWQRLDLLDVARLWAVDLPKAVAIVFSMIMALAKSAFGGNLSGGYRKLLSANSLGVTGLLALCAPLPCRAFVFEV
jgi:hypothetical protein